MSGRKIAGGEFIITRDDVDVGKITGGAIIVSGGTVNAEELTGGGIVLARESVNIKRVHAAGGPISASNVNVESGSPTVTDPREIIEDTDRIKIKSEGKRGIENSMGSVSHSKVTKMLDINKIQAESTDVLSEDAEKNDEIDELILESEEEETKQENDNGSSEFVTTEIPNRKLSVIVVAEVLGLLSEDDEQYHKDRLILTEQYPELESILCKADTVDDAIRMSEEMEDLEFTDNQIQLMNECQNRLDSNDNESLRELMY